MPNLTATSVSLSQLRNLSLFVLALFWFAWSGYAMVRQIAETIDRNLLRIGMELRAVPQRTIPITVVHVPDLEYDKWLVDLAGAEGLVKLFEQGGLFNGASTSTNVYGLVLEYPVSLVRSQAENILADLHKAQAPTDSTYKSIRSLLVRRTQLVDIINGPQVVIGLQGALPSQWPVLKTDANLSVNLPGWLQNRLWAAPAEIRGVPLTPGPIREAFPVVVSHELQKALVAQKDGEIHAGFTLNFVQAGRRLELSSRSESTTPDESNEPRWRRGEGIVVGATKVTDLSSAGAIVPLYGNASGVRATLRQLTLQAALAQKEPVTGWIIIGRDGSATLDAASQTIAALADGAVMHEPLWWSPARLLALAGCIALLVVVAVVTTTLRFFYAWSAVTVLWIVASLTGQLFWQYWLPVAWSLVFVCAGGAVIAVWRWQRVKIMRFAQRGESINLDYAGYLIQGEEFDKAYEILADCPTSGDLLQKLYTLAGAQTAKDQPAAALTSLLQIRRRRRRYRDVEPRIETLRAQLADEPQPVRYEPDQRRAAAAKSALPTVPARRKPEAPQGSTQRLSELNPRPRATLGRYEIQEEIGRGAFGTVYRAFDPQIARQVAIKTLNYRTVRAGDRAELKERFFREAQAAGRLNHPHIVHIYDVGEEDQLAYIAMDYARGKALSAYTATEELLPVVDVYQIVRNVAEALAYAHSHNVIHRDIKPGNIMLNRQPYQLKVTDFGIARITDYAQTATGEILGSPLYMAPEQLAGKPAGPQADIFSLGVTFYQLLTGHLPFQGESLASLSYDIIHRKQKSVRSLRADLPGSATRITNRALQKKPEDRFESAADMAEAFRTALTKDFGRTFKESRFSNMGERQ